MHATIKNPPTENEQEMLLREHLISQPHTPTATPADLDSYRITKPSLLDHRPVRFGLVILIQIILLGLAMQIKWTPAQRIQTLDTTTFQAVKIAPPQVAPPPPPSTTSTGLPAMPSAAPAAPPKVITVNPSFTHSFALPQTALPQMDLPAMQHTSVTNTSGNPSNNSQADNGDGNGTTKGHTGAFATDKTEDLIAALDADGGDTVGVFRASDETWPYASEIDDLRHNHKLDIHWDIINSGSLKLAPDGIPILAKNHNEFVNGLDGTTWATNDLTNLVTERRPKTAVLLASFIHSDSHMAAANLIDALRKDHVKLCIITVVNPPPADLIDYVRESGGVIVCTHGVPPSVSAALLQKAADSK